MCKTTSNGRMQAGARLLRLRGKVQWRAMRAPRCPPVQIPTLARASSNSHFANLVPDAPIYTAHSAFTLYKYIIIHTQHSCFGVYYYRPRRGYVYNIIIYLWFQGEHSVTTTPTIESAFGGPNRRTGRHRVLVLKSTTS